MDFDTQVKLAIYRHFAEIGRRPTPAEVAARVWHVVLFYTTGEAVRRTLADEGQAGYTPMVYGIFDRGTWVDYRKALESAWRPYVDGERNLSEAAADLTEALRAGPTRTVP